MELKVELGLRYRCYVPREGDPFILKVSCRLVDDGDFNDFCDSSIILFIQLGKALVLKKPLACCDIKLA